jgi:hypothetical protein
VEPSAPRAATFTSFSAALQKNISLVLQLLTILSVGVTLEGQSAAHFHRCEQLSTHLSATADYLGFHRVGGAGMMVDPPPLLFDGVLVPSPEEICVRAVLERVVAEDHAVFVRPAHIRSAQLECWCNTCRARHLQPANLRV